MSNRSEYTVVKDRFSVRLAKLPEGWTIALDRHLGRSGWMFDTEAKWCTVMRTLPPTLATVVALLDLAWQEDLVPPAYGCSYINGVGEAYLVGGNRIYAIPISTWRMAKAQGGLHV